VRIIEQGGQSVTTRPGLAHRDVKPSNILLDEDDFAYPIDFGIARSANETGLTGTGAMIGRWHYMAPERLRASEADAGVDIYALACVVRVSDRKPPVSWRLVGEPSLRALNRSAAPTIDGTTERASAV
jgi:serine/threonine protein kinase